MHNAYTMKRSEVLALLETYEGLLKQKWDLVTLAKWTEWKAVLARMEGR